MAAAGMEVQGLPAFLESLDAAARELDDLAPVEAGQLLVDRGEAASPRSTGVLAAGHQAVIADGHVRVINATEYAVYVHAREPWLARMLEQSTDELLNIYAEAAAEVVDTIRGA